MKIINKKSVVRNSLIKLRWELEVEVKFIADIPDFITTVNFNKLN